MIEFTCEKKPATGSRGMVVTNHPLASAAACEVLMSGGNAIDAAVAALFALTVVEPMMVGILGGGVAHIRFPDGKHLVIDGLSTAPLAAQENIFEIDGPSDGLASSRTTVGRKNLVGPLAVAVPGALAGWCETQRRYGKLPLADLIEPARRYAHRGFIVTPYLETCIQTCAAELTREPSLRRLYLPDDRPLEAGSRFVQGDYAQSLELIAKDGAKALYQGPLGAALISHLASGGGVMAEEDLADYRLVDREPIKASYRGFDIYGPPPPASAGVHIAQMLNILEGYDLKEMGFASPQATHLLAEVMKIAFADRSVSTADPAFVNVPVEKLTSKQYAAERRAKIADAASAWRPEVSAAESANTTHVTITDADGLVVATTQTINSLFGAFVLVPGTGMIANNYMYNFDPRPGGTLSVKPGKRVFTSMAPVIASRDQRFEFAIGLPGGLRIWPSVLQSLVNLIDHDMTLQEAVEAPRIWTEGGVVEMEPGFSALLRDQMTKRGHAVKLVDRVAGGMNAIRVSRDGTATGAGCWRADGTPIGISGGLARKGITFSIA